MSHLNELKAITNVVKDQLCDILDVEIKKHNLSSLDLVSITIAIAVNIAVSLKVPKKELVKAVSVLFDLNDAANNKIPQIKS